MDAMELGLNQNLIERVRGLIADYGDRDVQNWSGKMVTYKASHWLETVESTRTDDPRYGLRVGFLHAVVAAYPEGATFGERHTLLYDADTSVIRGKQVRVQECRCGVFFAGVGDTQQDAVLDIAEQHGRHYDRYMAIEHIEESKRKAGLRVS